MSVEQKGYDADAAHDGEIASDRRSLEHPMCGSAQAASPSEQDQHVADEVCAAARRMYLGIPDDKVADIEPFDRYVVVEMMRQVWCVICD